MTTTPLAVAIVGEDREGHLAASFHRSAQAIHLNSTLFDVAMTRSRVAIVNSIAWRAMEKRAPHASRLTRALLSYVKSAPKSVVITTGLCPIEKSTLQACSQIGVTCLHFSSDDPWNPSHQTGWHEEALGAYDVVFTPRRSNVSDLERVCKEVRYLPFAYDEDIVRASLETHAQSRPKVLFVGGADADRVTFFRSYLKADAPVSLVGGYWDRVRDLRPFALGSKSPQEVGRLTRASAVNLCLVRRANRDGHVMRSFEAGALGGCMVVEDTAEHREIFGPDGDAVVYFRSPEEAAARVKSLLTNGSKRMSLARNVRERITSGKNTYTDRLRSMLAVVGTLRKSPK